MKIGFFYQPQIKLNNNCSSNPFVLRLRDNLNTDVFERSEISFGKKEKSEIEKEEEMVKFFNLNDVQVERFEELYVSKFDEYYEALLAAKFDLSDKEADIYLSKKGQEIKYLENEEEKSYIPFDDELMICVKEGFSDKQMKHFAYLRNKTADLRNSTVRGKGELQKYPFNYVLDCVRENKTSEQIKKEEKLAMLIKEGYSLGIIADLSMLSMKQIERFEELKDKYRIDYALNLVKLSPDEFKRFEESKGEYEFIDALDLAKLTPDELKRFEELKDEYEFIDALNLAKLTPDQFKEFGQMKDKSGYLNTLYFAGLTPEEFKKLEELTEYGFEYLVALNLAKLSPDELKRFEELKDEYGISDALKLAKLSPDELKRFEELKDEYGISDALNLAKLSPDELKRFEELKDEYGISDALNLAKLSPDELKRFEEVRNGCEFIDALDLAKLTPDEFKRFEESKGEYEFIDALDLAKLTPDELKRFEELKDEYEDWAALDLVKLTPDELKRFEELKDEYEFIDALDLVKLTPDELKRFEELKDEYKDWVAFDLAKLSPDGFKRFEELKDEYEDGVAFDLAKLSPDGFKRFEELKDEYEFIDALKLAKLSSEELERFKKIPIKPTFDQAIELVKYTNVTSLTQEIIDKLPDGFFWETSANCKEGDYKVIKGVIGLLLSKSTEELGLKPMTQREICLKRAKSVIFKQALLKDKDYIWADNGDFELKTGTPFKINLKTIKEEGKPVLAIQKDDSDKIGYIAYNGAIAQVKELTKRDSEQFKKWANLHPQKQSKILAQAADSFVFNLFDENNECIIGTGVNGIKPCNIKAKTTKAIKNHYAKAFKKLERNNNLTPQNILRIMPNDCILSICPFGNDKIHYAIVAEWFDRDNKHWQLEIHSQDTDWNDDDKWVARLHFKEENERKYFQFENNKNGYNYCGEFSGENCEKSHIKIPSGVEDKLLNNPDFQAIAQQISIALYNENQTAEKNEKIKKVCKDFGIDLNDDLQNQQNLINYCLKNPLDFKKHKDLITKLRANLGFPELV